MLLGDPVAYSFNFSNASVVDTGYAPFIELAVDTSGPDGATSLPTDGYGTPVVIAGGLELVPIQIVNLTMSGQAYTNNFTGAPRVSPAGFGNGDTIYIYQLPFSSFTPGQFTTISVSLPTSNLADIGTPLPIAVTPGFRDDDPTAPFEEQGFFGTIQNASATPELYRLTKTYLGPENETATGPNYKRRYRLDLEIATGQTLTGVVLNDVLSDTMQWTGNSQVVMRRNGVIIATDTTGSSATPTTPGGTIRGNFGSVTGMAGVDASLEFEFYVPRDRSTGAEILPQPTPPAPDPSGGTDSILATNTGNSLANWTPLDARDPSGPVNKAAPDNGPHTLQEHSVAVQKSVDIVTVGAPNTPIAGPVQPGVHLLRYTINFQVSDYYAVRDLVVEDVLGDGQRLYIAGGLTPTLSVQNPWTFAGGGTRAVTSSGAFAGANNIDYERRYTIVGSANSDPTVGVEGYAASGPVGAPFSTPTVGAIDGSTFLRFRISDELIDRGLPGLLVGGEIANGGGNPQNNNPTAAFGPARGTIVYWVQVKEDFSDNFPSGDPSVDQGDTLSNNVPLIRGEHLSPLDLADGIPTSLGTIGTDDTGASIGIPLGVQTKTVYAINDFILPSQGIGDTVFSVQAGDLITFKLTYTLPISRFEDLQILDIAPLPVMPVGPFTSYTFDRTPDVGFLPFEIEVAPDDTFFSTFPAFPDLAVLPAPLPGTPSITTNQTTNTITMDFYDFEDSADRFTTISLLVTLPITDDPFVADLFLTNQLRVNEGSTNAGNQTVEDQRRIQLVRPNVTIQKGAVAANNAGQTAGVGAGQIVFDPASNPTGTLTLGGMPLSSTNAIDSAAEASLIGGMDITTTSTPIDLRPDAGDLVRYAIVAQNVGRGDAFNVRIADTIPDRYERPATFAGLNLRVLRGDGTLLTLGTDYTLVSYNPATGAFEIELVDNYTAGNQNPPGQSPDTRSGGLSRGEAVPSVFSGTPPVTPITNGSNTVIVLYDVRLVDNPATPPEVVPQPNFTITNTAFVTQYMASETSTRDLTDPSNVPGATDPSDTANVTIELPTIAKVLVGTEVTEPGNNAANQATIGELLTYTITLTVPEGQMGQTSSIANGVILRDTLDRGLAFVDVTAVTASPALSFAGPAGTGLPTVGTNPANTVITPAVGPSNAGRIIAFNLGQITNTDLNNAVAETIVITYRAVVLNTNAAPSANNQAGGLRNNSLDIDWNNGTGVQDLPDVSAPNITIVEPTLSTVKQVRNVTDGTGFQTSVSGDANDVIQYRITITNANAATDTTAFDVALSDVIPASILTPTILTVTSSGNIRVNGVLTPPGTGDFTIAGSTLSNVSNLDMERNSSITITVQGTFTGATGDTIPNTAEVRWSSMDGVVGDRSVHNTFSEERDGSGGLLGSGALNDYRVQSTATIDSPPLVRKTIIATSETHTPPHPINVPGVVNADAAIGELVRYRLYVSIGEGLTRNFQIQDNLPVGVRFLNDGTARWAFIASAAGNMTSSTITPSGITITGLGSAPTIIGDGAILATLSSAAITGTFNDDNIATSFNGAGTGDPILYTSGQDVFFRFGNLQNNDNDTNLEFVVVEFNALVENIAANQEATTLPNAFTVLLDTLLSNDGIPGYVSVTIDNDGSGTRTAGDTTVSASDPDNNAGTGPNTVAFSNNATLGVVEPQLAISKSVTATTGAIVTYQVVVSNPAGSTATTAFNTRVLDNLNPANFTLILGSVSASAAGGASAPVNNSAGNTVDFSIDTIPVGGSVTITYQVNVLTTPSGTATLDNTAATTWTSLPGPQGSLPFFGTVGATLGTSGTATGERDGSGGVNDYTTSATARLGSLGDRVYFDANANGVQDAGEPGIVGVPVTVRWEGPNGIFGDADDSVITVITGANGIWTVTGLPVGAGQDYRVSVPTTIGGMSLTDVRDNGGPPNTNPDGLGVGISAITLSGAAADTTNNRLQDFGYRGTASLGNRIYIDADGDGVQDAASLEPSLPGVLVTLTWAGLDNIFGSADDLVFTTTSSNPALPGDPNYLFQFLPAGDFRVVVSAVGGVGGVPLNMMLTDSIDDGGVPNPAGTVTTNLTTGENELTIDFGYRGNASVGNFVWYDANGDGIQTANEPGIPNATVTVVWFGADNAFGGGDDVTFTTTTDANGLYTFLGIPANALVGGNPNYRVTVTPPAAFPTLTDSIDNGILNAANPVDIQVSPIEGDPLNDRTDVDFGFRGTAQLGNFVWEDLNGNGRQDGGEPGIDGVTVELFYAGADGVFQAGELVTPLRTTVTAGGGLYGFGNLAAGVYRLRFGNTVGVLTYTRTAQDSPVASDATDSDAAVATGFTGDYTLTNGASEQSVDAGLYRPVTLGNRVFFDFDGDGNQDSGEPGIPNVAIQVVWLGLDGVLGGGDDQTFTTTTGTDGLWSVANLPPGNFQVTATPPGGSGFTVLTDSIDNGILNAVNPVTVSSTSGVNRSDVDFGFRGTGSIGNFVWLDADGDGVQDSNGLEPGLPGVTVTLRYDANADGDFTDPDDGLFTTVSDAAGAYLFGNLPPGSYQVVVSAVGGVGGVPDNATLTDALDNGGAANPNPTGSGVGVVQLGAGSPEGALGLGEHRLTIDFGYRGTASIGDQVWYDADGDGVQDAGEPGIPGVAVALLWSGPDGVFGSGDDVTFTTTTDANGNYLFSSLPVNGASDAYRVTVTPPGAFPTQTFDADGLGTPNQATLNLGPTENNVLQDFGYRGTAQLGNFVWEDLNGNGRQDGGEPGIDGVTVELFYAGADGVFQADELVTPLRTTVTAGGRFVRLRQPGGGGLSVAFWQHGWGPHVHADGAGLAGGERRHRQRRCCGHGVHRRLHADQWCFGTERRCRPVSSRHAG